MSEVMEAPKTVSGAAVSDEAVAAPPLPRVHTVIQPGADGELRAYPKGSEPPILMMPNARNPFPMTPPVVAAGGVNVPPLQATPPAPEPDPNTIEGMAAALGLREAADLDDRADDSYTSWIAYNNKPLFFFDLDDDMKAQHARKVLDNEKAKAKFSQPIDDKKQPTQKQIAAMLDAKSREAEAIGAAEVGIYDWVLENAYRGCSVIRNWRRLPVPKRKVLAEIIVRSSTVGQNDYQVLTMR